MQDLPGEPNKSTTGWQIEVFTLLYALCEDVQKGRKVNVPRIEFLFSNQRENQRHRTVKGVVKTLVFCLFRGSDGSNPLSKLNGILSLLALTEELVDDFLLEEPSIEHALLFCHQSTSLFICFDRCFRNFDDVCPLSVLFFSNF